MLSYPVQSTYLPAMKDTVERTSVNILRSVLNRTTEQTMRSVENSRYLSSQSGFHLFAERLEQISETPENWNSYGSPAPNSLAIANAKPILGALRTKLLLPERILPSAEGGVAFTFVSETPSRAVIESLNDGERYVLLYDLQGNSKTIEWSTDETEHGLNLVEEIRVHLRSRGIAAQG
jgi:hypothetical protein